MIAEMIIWGFFSACGWLTANWIKEEIWPPADTTVIQSDKKEDKIENKNLEVKTNEK